MSMIKDFNKTAIITPTCEVSYDELLRRISLFARVAPVGQGEKVMIFSENREAWAYALFSVWSQKAVAVPVDASNTVDDMAYILSDCKPAVVWVSRKRKDTLAEAMKKSGVSPRVYVMGEFERAALTDEPQAEISYDEQDTALIIYTSGTTGNPKGVMLNFLSLIVNMDAVSKEVQVYNEDRRTLTLLPLHHILPLMGTLIIPIVKGGGIIICPTLNGPDIMDALNRGRVGVIIGVPRLWQTIYWGVKKKLDAHLLTRALFGLCSWIDNKRFSRFVFGAVHKKMGGHVAFMVSGGAALDAEIARGLHVLGFTVLEGYGMTETAPMISFTRPGDEIPGCAGKMLSNMEYKLVGGELCVKGPNVMQGYLNRPEETAKVIDADGYIHTGDLATIDDQQRVYITGRTKEIIVLSNGKNVQPAEIEYKLEKFDTMVKEAAVTQDGDMLCAIIVPQKDWAQKLSDEDVEADLKELVLRPYNQETENYKKIMRVFVYRDDLPRTKMDKLQRFKLQDILKSGAHRQTKRQPVVEPTWEEYQIIKNYIQQEKGLEIRPTDHVETDLGFDSLDKVGLQTFIEQTFGTKIDASTMAGYPNIQALAEKVMDNKTQVQVEQVDWKQTLQQEGKSLRLPDSTILLPLLVKSLKFMHCVYNRLSFVGRENIPQQGPFILAPNHQSYVDGGVVLAGVDWKNITQCYFYATEEHVRSASRKWMARHSNMVLMERANLKDSIQKLAQILRQGKNIIIFPEGSRTHTGQVGAFKKTFAILSKELNVPIVPVCIRGAYEALPRHRRWLKPTKIVVEYLPSVQSAPDMTAEQLSEMVRQRIVAAMQHT
ncbi:MAG: AMP-binding protein [Bacteroidaceae bacterium]|nr:AMP-binding protein [Bacteroidaceae bacterium]